MAELKAGTGGLRDSVPCPPYVLRFQLSLYAGMMELADMQDFGDVTLVNVFSPFLAAVILR